MTAELHILGSPSLTRNGKLVRLHSLKALALLAFLVCETDKAHSRVKLAALLWANNTDARAKQSLRQALYSLRQALGAAAQNCLVISGNSITFSPHPDLNVDLLDFRQLSASAAGDLDQLRRAAALFKGSLLEGLELEDCPAFDEWLFLQRDQTEQQAIRVLQTLIDKLVAKGDYWEARDLALRLVGLDNLHEGAHRRLMRIQAALGDQRAVRRQYQLCRTILLAELGVDPAPETERLYEQLMADPTLPPPAETVPSPGSISPLLPFWGCEDELETLQEQLRLAASGKLRFVLLRGEAGIGKTMLVTQFFRRALSVGPVRSLNGRCYAVEAHTPYTMWADALAPLATDTWKTALIGLPDIWRQQLARLVPELNAPAESEMIGASAEENHLRLLQGIVQGLAHLSHSQPLLLFFDDLHWADASSLELLHYAVRHLLNKPILLIGTVQSEEVVGNSLLQAILRDSVQKTIVVSQLDEPGIEHFMQQSGISPRPELVARLRTHCAGNRFVFFETLHQIMNSPGISRLEELNRLPIPERVQEMIQARTASLQDEQRRILATVATVGRSCDLTLVRHISGQPEDLLLDLVDELMARSFLREEKGGATITFVHDLVRQVVYAGLGGQQRRALHRRTAESLLKLHSAQPSEIAEEAAFHFKEALDPRALRYFVQAAERAENLFAYPHAGNLVTHALTLHRKLLVDDSAGRFDLYLVRERILDLQGRRAEQGDDINRLLELARALDDPLRLAVATIRQAGYFSNTHQPDQARDAGEQALALYRDLNDIPGEAQALRELGFLFWSTENYGSALEYNRKALELHRQLGDLAGEATALHNLAEIYRGLGSPRQALVYYEQALNLHWSRQDDRRQGLVLYGMAHAQRQLNNREAAMKKYRQVLLHTQVAGDRVMTSRAYHELASLLAETAFLQQAQEAMQQAIDISREVGYSPGIAHGLIGLSALHSRTGEPEAALQELQEALIWLDLMEDQAGLGEIQARLESIKKGSYNTLEPLPILGWVKSHVTLAEGKVYCEFESPLARQGWE